MLMECARGSQTQLQAGLNHNNSIQKARHVQNAGTLSCVTDRPRWDVHVYQTGAPLNLKPLACMMRLLHLRCQTGGAHVHNHTPAMSKESKTDIHRETKTDMCRGRAPASPGPACKPAQQHSCVGLTHKCQAASRTGIPSNVSATVSGMPTLCHPRHHIDRGYCAEHGRYLPTYLPTLHREHPSSMSTTSAQQCSNQREPVPSNTAINARINTKQSQACDTTAVAKFATHPVAASSSHMHHKLPVGRAPTKPAQIIMA